MSRGGVLVVYSSFSVSLIDVAARIAVRRLKLSTFISRMDAWCTSLSIAATVIALSGKTLSQPLNGWFAVIMMPTVDTEAMQAHLNEISKAVAPGAHAVILMDQAGWHTTGALTLPENLSLLFLPPKSPELNPVENIWQYLRQTWLANRVFDTYDAILHAGCQAWNNLIALPDVITSIGTRDWAKVGQ
jgi:low affinity Fe/Cu permease